MKNKITSEWNVLFVYVAWVGGENWRLRKGKKHKTNESKNPNCSEIHAGFFTLWNSHWIFNTQTTTNHNMNMCCVWSSRSENTKKNQVITEKNEPKKSIANERVTDDNRAENTWLLPNCRFSVYQQLFRLRIIDGQQRFSCSKKRK